MTTFAKRTFDAAAYLRYRPTYSHDLISQVVQYARCSTGAVAVDLGCGPGQASVMLASTGCFKKVVGLDPSQGMIDAAKATLKNDPSPLLGEAPSETSLKNVKECDISYQVGNAEDLSFLASESVELVTAGQAAHWFNHQTVYKELHRILKPGGTVAYWGYAYLYLPDHPQASARIQDLGLNRLGPYWEEGRKIPESLYDLLPFPDGDGWDTGSFRRVKFDKTPSSAFKAGDDNPTPPETAHQPIAMYKSWDLDTLKQGIKTWSSVHNYSEKHPSEPNVVDTFFEEIKTCLPEKKETFKVEWPVGMLLMRKKS